MAIFQTGTRMNPIFTPKCFYRGVVFKNISHVCAQWTLVLSVNSGRVVWHCNSWSEFWTNRNYFSSLTVAFYKTLEESPPDFDPSSTKADEANSLQPGDPQPQKVIVTLVEPLRRKTTSRAILEIASGTTPLQTKLMNVTQADQSKEVLI